MASNQQSQLESIFSAIKTLFLSVSQNEENYRMQAYDKLQKAFLGLYELEENSVNKLIQHIIHFILILQEEIKLNQEEFRCKTYQLCLNRFQHRLIKQVRAFSEAAMIDSRGKIDVSLLESHSEQFKKCQNAIFDNQEKRFLNSHPDASNKLTISMIIGINNQALTQKFQQVKSCEIDNNTTKIKGLFSTVPLSSVYSLCSYGFQTATPIESNSYTDMNIPTAVLFQTPWYLSNRLTTPNNSIDVGSKTSRSPYVSARKLASAHPVCASSCRFSKYSLNSRILSQSRGSCSTENGMGSDDRRDSDVDCIVLILCRVKLIRACSVPGAISERDIDKAKQRQYDAIYSQER